VQTVAIARHFAAIYPPHELATTPYLLPTHDGYYHSLSLGWARDLALYYTRKGPRLLWKNGFGSELVPQSIIDELLKPIAAVGGKRAELAEEIRRHREPYLEAFHASAGSWNNLDICPKSVIESLMRGELPRDNGLSPLGAKSLNADQVERCLTHVIELLEDEYPDTYHLALLDDLKYPSDLFMRTAKELFWSVKVGGKSEGTTMFFEEWPANREVDGRVDEGRVTRNLVEIFGWAWKCLGPAKLVTDKEEVVNYLKSQRSRLKPRLNW
jgi:hypothetical protein